MRAALAFAMVFVPASAQVATQPLFADCAATKPTSACRVNQPLEITEVLNRLSGKEATWWRQGDAFTMAARRTAEDLQACCAFDLPMARLPGTDIWTLTIRSPHLDTAIFDVMVFSSADRRAGNFRTLGEWRGPKAPPAPEQAGTLTGRVETIEIDSPNLGEKRKVEVYLPPGHTLQTRYPIIYMADGRTVEHYAKMLEPLIASRKVPPLILAGLRAGQGNPVPGDTVGRRAAEYLFGRVKGDAFFLKHESFFLGEVIPEMERRFAASPEAKDRVVLGQSNGASWAIDMALRHPAQFSRVIGFSPCWAAGYRKWDAAKPKLFLTAGIFEQTCAETVAASAQAAKAAGQDVTFETHASGHSGLMWDVQFIDALSWAYPAR